MHSFAIMRPPPWRMHFEFAFATHFTKEKLPNTDNLVDKAERPKILIGKLPKNSLFAND